MSRYFVETVGPEGREVYCVRDRHNIDNLARSFIPFGYRRSESVPGKQEPVCFTEHKPIAEKLAAEYEARWQVKQKTGKWPYEA